jgi:hypothetical protein
MQARPLIMFRVGAGETRLGYTVPPGNWGIQATLSLGSTHPAGAPRPAPHHHCLNRPYGPQDGAAVLIRRAPRGRRP